MRQIHRITIQPGGRWPEAAASSGGIPEGQITPFWWIHVDNRSPVGTGADADVLLSLDGQADNDAARFWERIRAGERLVRNVGKRTKKQRGDGTWTWSTEKGGTPPADELHFLNLSATQTATLWVETDTERIHEYRQRVPSGAEPLPVNIAAAGNTSVPAPGGAANAMVPVGDVSVFTTETTTLLGISAAFTGAMHDAGDYNWFGAKSNVSGGQAGTLFIDESSAASGANIYQVATQAAAAEPATHGSPATVAATTFGARIAPTKTVLRFLRVVYVNGGVAQTGTFEIQSSLSPLN